MTKLEQKAKSNEQKRIMKEVWTTKMESNDSEMKDSIGVPSHYKKYTIQDIFIILQKPT